MDQNKIITTQVIEDVVNRTSHDRLLVRDLVEAMETIGFGLAIMIFAFGIIIPLPPPFPSIIALPLVVFSAQMMLGYQAPKLPKRFANLTVKRSVVAMLVQKSSPYIRKVERILRPRLSAFVSFNAQRVIGFFTLLFSSFIVLPMPLSNFIPGLGILIISFGLLGKDGLVVICGVVTGLIGMAISITAVVLGVEALKHIKDFFF
ncbi:MAG: exopolysaccharide biosynthesis protein [Rickettsiales bacterium]|nr:exopolysaccharide biosynthesis protein [Rickettsiales bacterium]